MLSFRTMIDLGRTRGMRARIGFRIGEQRFLLAIDDGRVELARGETEDADLVFTGTTGAIGAAAYGGVPLRDLEAQGELKIEGDRALARRFVTLFPLPPKASAAA